MQSLVIRARRGNIYAYERPMIIPPASQDSPFTGKMLAILSPYEQALRV